MENPAQKMLKSEKVLPNYRRLANDPKYLERMKKRSEILKWIREFFWRQEFLEVETPLMVRLPGMEPNLDPFKTELKMRGGSAEDMYLITSPEYAMKKLLVGGMDKIFQLGKVFRNKEEGSDLHSPEFTMLEWYRAGAGYEEIMEDTINLVSNLVEKMPGHTLAMDKSWRKMKVAEAFEEFAGVKVADFEDGERLRRVAAEKGYSVGANSSYEEVFFSIFLNEIEPRLGFDGPVILYEYPVQMGALARKCAHDERYVERFEVYICGMEICNAFGELTDAAEQKARLESEREERRRLGKDVYDVDQSFIDALECGMPSAGGNALGVDRLVMLLTDAPGINDVLFFPQKDL